MSVVYNWELNGAGSATGRRRVKKSGTVVLHSDDGVDSSFGRLLKPHLVQRLHINQVANHSTNNNTNNSKDTPDDAHKDSKSKKSAEDTKSNKTRPGQVDADATVEQAEEHAERPPTTQRMPLMTATTAERLRSVNGFTELLPCQAQCYRGIFNGRDVILHSRTGSGKTLAYALPIIERHLLESEEDAQAKANAKAAHDAGPFMLILVFSHDLALQTRSVLSAIYPQLRIAVAGWKDDDDDGDNEAAPTAKETVTSVRVEEGGTQQSGQVCKRVKTDTTMSHESSKSKNKSKSKSSRTAKEHEEHGKRTPAPVTVEDSARTPASPDAQHTHRRAAVDILIGTVSEVDKAIRGVGASEKEGPDASGSSSDDDDEDEDEDQVGEQTQKKAGARQSGAKRARVKSSSARLALHDGTHAIQPTSHAPPAFTVSVRYIRAIVIDEVDTTLGPHFSLLGRRVKRMLRFIRRGNGSLTSGLLTDYRAHHYVLCGATIPNWVIRAGFLGVKKYYYALVAAGEAKLPAQLDCRMMRVPRAMRVARAAQLLSAAAASESTRNAAHSSSQTSQTHTRQNKSKPENEKNDNRKEGDDVGQSDRVAQDGVSNDDDIMQHAGDGWLGRVVVFGTERQLLALEQSLGGSHAAVSSARRCAVMLGSRDARERAAAVARFNAGEMNTLLCTDVAARGLDFVHVRTVLMLSLPHTNSHMISEMFVHRAGRTARVGRPGRCIVMVDEPAEMAALEGIAKSTHVRFDTLVEQSNSTHPAGKHSNSSSAVQDKVKEEPVTAPSVRVFELTVRNPFKFASPAAVPAGRSIPTARAVLEAQLEPALRAQLRDVYEVNKNTEVVRFAVPVTCEGAVRSALWKYSVKDATA